MRQVNLFLHVASLCVIGAVAAPLMFLEYVGLHLAAPAVDSLGHALFRSWEKIDTLGGSKWRI
jgi:hypothetical protein